MLKPGAITSKNHHRFCFPTLFRRLILSWLLAVTVEYILLPGQLRSLSQLDGLVQMSLPRVCTTTGTIFALLWAASLFVNTVRAERWALAAAFSVLAAVALYASFSWPFLAGCLLIDTGLAVFAARGWNSQKEASPLPQKDTKPCLWITLGLSTTFFLFVSAWTVGRVYSFSTPTFDFGIFSQMFYHMTESGLPMTTVERDGLLSHFQVHMSPIYYLLLPFYVLAPTPGALQVLQAAVVTSSVIPLWKLGKHHGLSSCQRAILCVILLLYPAFSGGTSYDIHENCFLTPLLLWLFYGIDRKSSAITAAAALLTLTVKEDAAVYVAVIALWLIAKTLLRFHTADWKELLTGVIMLISSLIWFFLVTGYLAKHGDGVMSYRYNNFIYDGSDSLLTVIQAVLLCPMKAVYECVDSEKLWFLAMTMLPLLGFPLLTRRFERYLLLIPYILVNLMSDYPYQHDIFFQYTFGSTACLMYLTAVNLAEWKIKLHRSLALFLAAAVSAASFGAIIVPKSMRYPVQCVQYFDYYQNIRDVLSAIPEDAGVTATTFYTAFLSQREILYDVRYSSRAHMLETEYIVLSISAKADYQKYATGGRENGLDNLIRFLEQNGYKLYDSIENVLVIYYRP